MSRFYGKVGYIKTEETRPGVYVAVETEKLYRGDVIKFGTRWENRSDINDNINVNIEISIMADPYAYEHFSEIKYVEYMGALWKVTSATPDRPRISLSLGGLYNGQ